jgi:DNA-binding NarL/FixJ family response regulator
MNAEARQRPDPLPRSAADPPVVAIADSATMRRRVAAALAEQELRVAAVLDAPNRIDEPVTDGSTVIVFACDIDAPREMASLRRLCREAPLPAVVAISPPATGTAVRRALDAGTDGLVFDPELELTLATTVRAVAIGQSVVPRKLRASVEKPVLSHRELQVLGLVRHGLTNAEIAERLYLAESTIKSHLASIFTKFGVRSRKEVVAAFVELEQASLAVSGGGESAEQATA